MEKLSEQLAAAADEFAKLVEETTREDKDIYSCLLCRDIGWIVDGDTTRLCSCQAATRENSRILPIPRLQKMNFANFDLKLYPETIKTTRGRSYREIAKDALGEAMCFSRTIALGKSRPGLVFEGPVGSGKTFLAAAIANDLLAKNIDVEFIVVPEFLDQLRQNIKSEGDQDAAIIRRTKEAAVLVLDDMGAHNFSPWVQNMLFTIINFRLNHQLPIVITTNLDMNELAAAVGERIASRLMEIGSNVKMFVDKDIRYKLNKEGTYQW